VTAAAKRQSVLLSAGPGGAAPTPASRPRSRSDATVPLAKENDVQAFDVDQANKQVRVNNTLPSVCVQREEERLTFCGRGDRARSRWVVSPTWRGPAGFRSEARTGRRGRRAISCSAGSRFTISRKPTYVASPPPVHVRLPAAASSRGGLLLTYHVGCTMDRSTLPRWGRSSSTVPRSSPSRLPRRATSSVWASMPARGTAPVRSGQPTWWCLRSHMTFRPMEPH
jgi:hypothetical protein